MATKVTKGGGHIPNRDVYKGIIPIPVGMEQGITTSSHYQKWHLKLTNCLFLKISI
jgi:hypothetical protein